MHNSFRLGVASWYRLFYRSEQFSLGISLSTREPPTASKFSPVSVTGSSTVNAVHFFLVSKAIERQYEIVSKTQTKLA